MRITRRTLLLSAAAGIAGSAVAGAGLALAPSKLQTDVPSLKILDQREYSILSAIADTLLPGTDTLPTATAIGVPEMVDEVISLMHSADAEELRLAFRLIENALIGGLLDLRPLPFTRASAETRRAALLRWQTSSIIERKKAYKALKGLCGASYWSHPEVARFTGYPGAPDLGQSSAPKPTHFANEAGP